jgi:hypothetical protein
MPPKPRATKGNSKGKGPKGPKTEVSEESRAAAAAAKEIGNKHFAAQKYDDAAKVSDLIPAITIHLLLRFSSGSIAGLHQPVRMASGPSCNIVCNNRAHFFRMLSHPSQAFSEAIEHDPTDHIFYSNRSACYSSTGKIPRAVEAGARSSPRIDSPSIDNDRVTVPLAPARLLPPPKEVGLMSGFGCGEDPGPRTRRSAWS